MYDRAAEEMERALALAPAMHTARLQLGLLYLTQAQVQASTSTLEPLAALADDSCFRHFALGLQYLMQDSYTACQAALTQGIALNVHNDALNGDMQKILDALPPPEADRAQADGNVWLSAYRQNDVPN